MRSGALLKPFSLFCPNTSSAKTFTSIDFPLRGKSDRAICVGMGNTITYCDVSGGKSLFNPGGVDESIAVSSVHIAKFSALDDIVITGASNYSSEHIFLYDLNRCSADKAVPVCKYQLAGVYPVSIAQHPVSSHFAVGFSDGTVCIYDPRFKRAVNRSDKPTKGIPSLSWNQSGSVLAVGANNVVSLLADQAFSSSLPFMTFSSTPSIPGTSYNNLSIRTMSFSPNSEDHLLVNFNDSGFAVWDTNQSDTLWSYKLNLNWNLERKNLQPMAPILNQTAAWTAQGSQVVALSPSDGAAQYDIFEMDFATTNVDLSRILAPATVNPAGDDRVASSLRDLKSSWVSVASSSRLDIFGCGATGLVSFIENKSV